MMFRRFFIPLLCLLPLSCAEAPLMLDGEPYDRSQLFSPTNDREPDRLWATSHDFMIATDSALASEAGTEIFDAGGNIVDAAIAVSFAISVVRPQSTGLGGGGFMLLHLAESNQTIAYDFRERAPAAADRDFYLKEDGSVDSRASLFGGRAVGVPGTIRGLVAIHKEHGSLHLERVIEPALGLARDGFPVYPDLHEAIVDAREDMDEEMLAVFVPEGSPLQVGDTLVQEDLATTLDTISREGDAPFYDGPGARAFASAVQSSGGVLTERDLAGYRLHRRRPLEALYRGRRIVTMPPPSSGVFILHTLRMWESQPLGELSSSDPVYYTHFLTESLRRTYADRARFGGDPDYFPVPVDKLLSADYVEERLRSIDSRQATRSDALDVVSNEQRSESIETTHFSIMDREGNAVASTQSVNYRFGARVMVPGYGIILNDTMDDFSAAPGVPNAYGLVGGEANSIEPGKTPLSSMSPTLVFDENDRVVAALGAPGGSRIITSILFALHNWIDRNDHPYAAVARRRIHHQFRPELVFMEEGAVPADAVDQLEGMGHEFKEIPTTFSKVFLVVRSGDDLIGVSDPRGDGEPRGR